MNHLFTTLTIDARSVMWIVEVASLLIDHWSTSGFHRRFCTALNIKCTTSTR